MRTNNLPTTLLAIAVLLLIANLLRPWLVHQTAHAQASRSSVYIEPGVHMMRAPDGSRQVLGKVVIDLSTGSVWGFPTTVEQPYPVDVTSETPPVSKPFLLGKFDFSAINK